MPSTPEMKPDRPRGYTLLEVMVVVAVLAIISLCLSVVVTRYVPAARISSARGSLAELARAMRRAQGDSGCWPLGNTLWCPAPWASVREVPPRAFTTADTVLASPGIPVVSGSPARLLRCAVSTAGSPCWNGPYLTGGLGRTPDPWGNPFMYTYASSAAGLAGAPNGIVVIWSTGPDGIDQTGCTSGACSFAPAQIAQGLSSVAPCVQGQHGGCSDDIVYLVGPATM